MLWSPARRRQKALDAAAILSRLIGGAECSDLGLVDRLAVHPAPLFERSWLLGYGWIMIAENGKMLERSIIDKTVWKPEGFAFEAPPTLKPPLAQHAERREPVVVEGEVIDTRTACLSLDADERARFDKLVAEAKEEKAPEAARVKAAYDAARIAEQVKRGVPKEKAERQVEAMYREVLLSDTVLAVQRQNTGRVHRQGCVG